MKTVSTYVHESNDIKIQNKIVPCLLFVTTENLPNVDGIKAVKISISGKANPFPFKEAIITDIRQNIDAWLYDRGYIKIGQYVK